MHGGRYLPQGNFRAVCGEGEKPGAVSAVPFKLKHSFQNETCRAAQPRPIEVEASDVVRRSFAQIAYIAQGLRRQSRS